MRRIDLLALADLPEGTMQLAWVGSAEPVLVVHTGGAVRAYQGVCSHEYFELDRGFLTAGGSIGANGAPAGTLTCALHLSRFDLGTGEALDPPAEMPLAAYEVVIADGRVLIEVPDGPLAVND